MNKLFVKKGNEFDIKQDKKLLMLRRLEMFLSTHPHNEENSEMADRITDVEILIENEMRIKEVELPAEDSETIRDIAKEEHTYNHESIDEISFRLGFEEGANFILNHIKKED